MSNLIKITIEAVAGAGRVCVAFAIADALRQHGMECALSGFDDESSALIEQSWRNRIKSIAAVSEPTRKPTVEITTRQLRRDSVNEGALSSKRLKEEQA